MCLAVSGTSGGVCTGRTARAASSPRGSVWVSPSELFGREMMFASQPACLALEKKHRGGP